MSDPSSRPRTPSACPWKAGPPGRPDLHPHAVSGGWNRPTASSGASSCSPTAPASLTPRAWPAPSFWEKAPWGSARLWLRTAPSSSSFPPPPKGATARLDLDNKYWRFLTAPATPTPGTPPLRSALGRRPQPRNLDPRARIDGGQTGRASLHLPGSP